MEAPTHVIDPDGDVMIVLEDANTPFAVWDQEQKKEGEGEQGGTAKTASASAKAADTDTDMKECYRIQVSAKRLMLASPVLEKTLTGGYKESLSLRNQGSVELTVYNWDLNALLMLLNIIHCRFNELHRDVSLELLGKFAVIVDYYGCNDVAKFFADMWINSLKRGSPLPSGKHSRDVVLWLWVSWVFKESDTFSTATSTAMTYSQERITHLGLPIPAKILDEMNEQREKAIQEVLASLAERRWELLSGTSNCKFECESLMLGSLFKQMHSNNLFRPKTTSPFSGLEYNGLVKTVREFKVPAWSRHVYNCWSFGGYFHMLPLTGRYSSKAPSSIPLSEYQVVGLSLDLYKSL